MLCSESSTNPGHRATVALRNAIVVTGRNVVGVSNFIRPEESEEQHKSISGGDWRDGVEGNPITPKPWKRKKEP